MTQKEFYKSQAWRRARLAYIQEREAVDGGICEVCHNDLGKIVHHIVWLNDSNVSDFSISLNPANFRYECQTCHNREKETDTNCRYRIAEDGSILPPSDEQR